jgi:Xaa-Pro aminopeptidase
LEEARKKMKPIMKNHKFSKKIYKKAAEKMVRTGGGVLSHPVGLAVHDDGPYRNGPLKVGHVFSVDPQLWVPEENLYLRYEDTIVVTKNGNENFTDFLPSELDDLESLVLEKGILQTLPENKMKWRK